MEPFNEKQEARNSSWKLLYIPIAAAWIFTTYLNNGGIEEQLLFWLIGLGITLILVVLIKVLNLHTQIDENGISVKFSLLMSKQEKFLWDNISRAEIKKYSPITEYGGWGYRLGLFAKKRAYSISGNIGLELTLKDGQTVMIGTKRAEEMQAYLQYLKSAHQNAAIK
jgi:hypothetical protein